MRISRGYRNNNPLNIRRCAKNRWVGLAEVQGDGEFCVFRSMVYGFRAAVYENGSEPRHEDVVSGWQLARVES